MLAAVPWRKSCCGCCCCDYLGIFGLGFIYTMLDLTVPFVSHVLMLFKNNLAIAVRAGKHLSKKEETFLRSLGSPQPVTDKSVACWTDHSLSIVKPPHVGPMIKCHHPAGNTVWGV